MVEKVTIGEATLYCGDCREVFLEALKSSGVSDLRRIVMWCAVRAFGGRFWRGK
jgi:hypothetical protein